MATSIFKADRVGNLANLSTDAKTNLVAAINEVDGHADIVLEQVSNSGDAYSSSKAYAVGDLCIYNNTLYRCITACSAGTWATNQSCFTADTLTSVTGIINRERLKTNYKDILSGTPSQSFAQTYIVYLDTDEWNVLSIVVYLGSISSSTRRGIIVTRNDVAVTTMFPLAGGVSLRPIAYDSTTMKLTLQTDSGVGGIIVHSIIRLL